MEQLALFVASSTGHKVLEETDSDLQDDWNSENPFEGELKSIVSRDTHLSKRELQVANLKAFIADQKNLALEPHARQATVPAGTSATPGERAEQETVFALTISAPKFPIFVQMPPPNEHFYYRSNLLQALDQALASPGQICIIHGVGGVGKTLAAVEYSLTHRDRYDAMFWCQADTAPGLAESYFQMALAVGVADSPEDQYFVTAKGRSWLQETGKTHSSLGQ